MDVMTTKFGNVTLRTSTPKRDPGDEDVAVLSSFLPEYLMSPAAVSKNKAFGCSLGRDCRLGDPRATPPGSRTARRPVSGLNTGLDFFFSNSRLAFSSIFLSSSFQGFLTPFKRGSRSIAVIFFVRVGKPSTTAVTVYNIIRTVFGAGFSRIILTVRIIQTVFLFFRRNVF